jgi:RNA polymerase sigma factor (sigma-70 family)
MDLRCHPTALIHAACRGEPVAIARLLEVCQPDVRRFAQRHCLLSDIDDAVQETLLVLVRKVHQLHKVAALSAWLIRIVQRNCRRLGRVALNFDPYEEAKVDAWMAHRPDEAIRMDVSHAIESLPAHYREVILLRDVEGLTVGEIAARIALTPAATKSRLHRARELTREYLIA